MNFENKCALFIDIDGTLKGRSPEALEENLRVIQLVRALGHKVFSCTGRSTAYIPPQLLLKENFDGIVAGSGAYVKIGEKEIFKKLVPHSTVKLLSEYFMDNNVPGILEGELFMYCFTDIFFRKPDWIKLNKSTFYEIITEDTPIQKFSVNGNVSPEVYNLLGDDYLIMQHNGYAEITLKGYTKASGIEVAIKELGIPQEQTIAIGDSMNDFEMMKYAGFSIAMGNAIDSIKDISDMVCGDVDDAGLSMALKKIFKL